MTKKPTVGVLCLDTSFDKIPGHIRNQATFDFPIVLKVVKGATPERLIANSDPALLQPFIDAAHELEAEGVAAVTGSCGFLMLFQDDIANALRVPFFSSSMLQLPMVHRMLPKDRKIGVMVANKAAFGLRHLRSVGAEHVPVEVIGMEDQAEFRYAILEGKRDRLDVEKLRAETEGQARRLVEAHPDIGALVIECTDLPPFSADIQRVTGRPVFDVITLTRMVYHALAQQPYDAR